MTDWYPLVRAWATHEGRTGVLDLMSDVDPALPVAPGQEFQIAMTVTPSGGAFRTYGYLLDDMFGDLATFEDLQGLRHLTNGRYTTFATGDEPRTAVGTVRMAKDAPEREVLLPRVIVGIMPAQGEKLVPCAVVHDQGFYIRRHHLRGRVLMLNPGARTVLPAEPPAPGLRLTGVSLARGGMISCTPDGTVTYQPHPSHLGYDRFECRYEDADGNTVWSDVTVHVGELANPGALPVDHG
ncbi:hypothetical protein OTB20_20205 [Streptomyces sp. H27-H1]|uniref:Ig-like domain-containing protein n=1 Tax=Streptomyces sp. H27-H1 TaxID=2996461 RepID=UPI002271B891|nr:Ig-like domain-containing protein [Streptomyces sp. H27-H1]MCY0928482.1 hypothetical protein [Streptomyces sp. H27-H1]